MFEGYLRGAFRAFEELFEGCLKDAFKVFEGLFDRCFEYVRCMFGAYLGHI